MSSLVLATLCLNEMEWLPSLYEQHKDWGGDALKRWIFVESADAVYAQANPQLVENGLSVDGTTDYLRDLARRDPRVVHLPLGLSQHKDKAQGKCQARNAYLESANACRPNFLFVLDADEFYCHDDQQRIMKRLRNDRGQHNAFLFRQRDIWRPPCLQHEPLLRYEVTGGYWDVRHVRGWRWLPRMQYRANHNTPEDAQRKLLDRRLLRFDQGADEPQCVHLGFASSLDMRAAKHRYYVARGEGQTDNRQSYVDCRAAFEVWQPGDKLPQGAKVQFYDGRVPEIFQAFPPEMYAQEAST